MDSLLDFDGTRIFVDERGPSDGHPLLFIHGGPGNSCWDFMASVGDLFAGAGMRVIGVDQRGVLRSDALPEGTEPSIDQLIDDFETIRRTLGIESWTVTGHSAGGAYALDYALTHPERVSGLVLDCPALDADATDRFRLPVAAEMLDAAGLDAEAQECRRLARLDRRLTAEDRTWEAMLPLGDRYLDLFLHDAGSRSRYERLMGSASDGLDWSRGMSHLPLMTQMYRDRRPLLDGLSVPSMMIVGESDMVAPPVVRDDYRAATGSEVCVVPDAGHFAFIEQPETYVAQMTGFVRED
ncbi:proline iminopeptidase [Microbacterium sp. W4I4]|uniref:alpha/beta hydrolase n=1 Tax=Microbacterium sp. W4I4 TaxID=3042295 RepID=UPI00277EEFC4|nr:alpha/beta hydrolase [Microbacterium sp. W4I4]MDQ0613358.1 proline iminopeptidase [Microbacterium sp. W4I4]